jgi:hypothetical protein
MPQQPTQPTRTTTIVDPLSRATATFPPSLFPSRQQVPPASGGLSGLLGAARAARSAFTGMAPSPTVTPPQTTQTTDSRRTASNNQTAGGGNRVHRHAYIHFDHLSFKKEDCASLQADEHRAVVEDAIQNVLSKFRQSPLAATMTLRITHS